MRPKRSIFFFLLGSCLAHAASSALLSPKPQKTLRVQISKDLASLDWQLSLRRLEFFIFQNLQTGLVELDEKSRPVPSLAKRWEVYENGKLIRFWLRPGVKWSDGVLLTPDQIVESWKRFLSPALNAPGARIFEDIDGAESFLQGKITDFSKVGIRAIYNKKKEAGVEVRLRKPVLNWMVRLSAPQTYPVRMDLIRKLGSQWTFPGQLVSLGPFLLKSRDTGNVMVLEKNPHYFGSRGNLDRIEVNVISDDQVFSAYQKGKIDFACHLGLQSRKQAQAAHSRDLKGILALGTKRLDFNLKGFQTSTVIFRKAIAAAISRQKLAKQLGDGVIPGSSLVPPLLAEYRAGAGIDYDPGPAKQLFTKAAGFSPTSLDLLVPLYDENAEENQAIGQFVKASLEENLGVSVNVKGVATAEAYTISRDTQSYHLLIRDWYADFPDPDSFYSAYENTFKPILKEGGAPEILTGIKAYLERIHQARSDHSLALRKKHYREADRILTEQQVFMVPLFYRKDFVLIRSNVTGFRPNPFSSCQFQGLSIR